MMKHHRLDDVSHDDHCNFLYQRGNLFRAVCIIACRYAALIGASRRTVEPAADTRIPVVCYAHS